MKTRNATVREGSTDLTIRGRSILSDISRAIRPDRRSPIIIPWINPKIVTETHPREILSTDIFQSRPIIDKRASSNFRPRMRTRDKRGRIIAFIITPKIQRELETLSALLLSSETPPP